MPVRARRTRPGDSATVTASTTTRCPSRYDAWQRYYNHRPRTEHGVVRLPLGLDFGYPINKIITWDRGTGIDVTLRNYCSVYEWIIVLAKPEYRLVDHSASGMGDVWRLGMERKDFGHPAPFPQSLPRRALLATGARTVLDPFMGSGTTLRAAKNIGRRGIGIEIEERYCEIAAKRCAQDVLDLGVAA
jgi:site-specific DNA-methyltransferase (adenine-specific)